MAVRFLASLIWGQQTHTKDATDVLRVAKRDALDGDGLEDGDDAFDSDIGNQSDICNQSDIGSDTGSDGKNNNEDDNEDDYEYTYYSETDSEEEPEAASGDLENDDVQTGGALHATAAIADTAEHSSRIVVAVDDILVGVVPPEPEDAILEVVMAFDDDNVASGGIQYREVRAPTVRSTRLGRILHWRRDWSWTPPVCGLCAGPLGNDSIDLDTVPAHLRDQVSRIVNETEVLRTGCGHAFHEACLFTRTLHDDIQCPVCLSRILEQGFHPGIAMSSMSSTPSGPGARPRVSSVTWVDDQDEANYTDMPLYHPRCFSQLPVEEIVVAIQGDLILDMGAIAATFQRFCVVLDRFCTLEDRAERQAAVTKQANVMVNQVRDSMFFKRRLRWRTATRARNPDHRFEYRDGAHTSSSGHPYDDPYLPAVVLPTYDYMDAEAERIASGDTAEDGNAFYVGGDEIKG